MTDEYIMNVKNRRQKQEFKELCFFGYGFGLFITLLFLLKYLFNTENLNDDKWYIAGMILGGIILGFTMINPAILKGIKNIISTIVHIIFYGLFGLLLTIVYYLCITPTGFFIKRKRKEDQKKTSNFVPREKTEVVSFSMSHNKLYQIGQIISLFLQKEYWLLLPSLIIIIILGVSFLFLQSNIVAPFIYTIF